MDFHLTVSDFRPTFDLIQIIYASGEIVKGDATKLEELAEANNLIPSAMVYLDTPGGDLFEGINLGRTISRLGFNTNVGKRSDKGAIPTICASAGVWAYLGGRYRYMLSESMLGVHQFYGQSPGFDAADYMAIGQIYSGEIIEYISECRAGVGLFAMLSSTLPHQMNYINHEKLRELNVITDGIYHLSWDFHLVMNAPYLKGHIVDNRGEHKILFMPTPKGALVLTIFFGCDDKDIVIDSFNTMFVFLDDKIYTIPEMDIGVPPHVAGDFISYIFEIPVSVGDVMLSCEWIGAGTQPINTDLFSGFKIKMTDDAKHKLSGVLEACRTNAEN